MNPIKPKRILFILCFAGFAFQLNAQTNDKVKTTFQTSREWRPSIDVRADAVMVYGVGGNPSDKSRKVPFEERVKSWKEKGYITHFMTGIAWGEYQDYFTGTWDGKRHLDEGQVQQNGDTIWHGHMVPYIVPSGNFLKYMKEKHIKRVIDAGVDAIFLEEPEFWARSGYSDAFKREWKEYYGFDWRPQHESPENTYLANKLKYQLYYRALNDVFSFAKEYGKTKGMDVKCYVPTHSLVNYSQWKIVSPEASLASLPCVDGYIAQVWTGTSREPNYYNGKVKERVFETAFLEYGSMESMTAPTGRKMFFLTDPIEDWARDWADYKKNYEATFTAQLLYPAMANYEIMPWPERIYEGLYRTSANSDKKERIPRHYSTQMQVMINTLNNMPVTRTMVSGSHGIGVLMANSLMFQRFPTHAGYEDPQLSNFYGLALPLLKKGVPVETVHIENLSFAQTLKNIQVLLMSYSSMKPMDKTAHSYLAQWVKDGGLLIYCGNDQDAFQNVREWWNTDRNHYNAPSEHLFQLLKVEAPYKAGTYLYGKGEICILRNDPKEFVLKENNDQEFVNTVNALYKKKTGNELEFKNYFTLQRGPYDIISVVDENADTSPYSIKGKLIDLYHPEIPVINEKQVKPGEQALLFNIDRINNPGKAQVLATAARVYNEQNTINSYSFQVKSPANTTNVMRILLPHQMKNAILSDASGNKIEVRTSWDEPSKTCFLSFENSPEGIRVQLNW